MSTTAANAAADTASALAQKCNGTVTSGFGDLTVDVPAGRWVEALRAARDSLGLRFFDWLSAVDELEAGFSVVCHLVAADNADNADNADAVTADARPARPLVHLLIRTAVPRAAPMLATATTVFPGASWHERETWEMFGIDFAGHPNLVPLLLPDGFAGRPLRKDFELAARRSRQWPGAKDPARGRAER